MKQTLILLSLFFSLSLFSQDTINVIPILELERDTVIKLLAKDPKNENIADYLEWMNYKIWLYENGSYAPEMDEKEGVVKLVYRLQPAIKPDYEGFLIFKIVNTTKY